MNDIKFSVTWSAEDVQSLREDWSIGQCAEWLEQHYKSLQDRMVESGWEIIESLLDYTSPE